MAICEKRGNELLIFPFNIRARGNSREYVKYYYLNWLFKTKSKENKRNLWRIDYLSKQIEVDSIQYPKYQTISVGVKGEYNVYKNILASCLIGEI